MGQQEVGQTPDGMWYLGWPESIFIIAEPGQTPAEAFEAAMAIQHISRDELYFASEETRSKFVSEFGPL